MEELTAYQRQVLLIAIEKRLIDVEGNCAIFAQGDAAAHKKQRATLKQLKKIFSPKAKS